MISLPSTFAKRLRIGLLLAMSCGGLSGCAAWETMKGPGLAGDSATWSQNLRSTNSGGSPTGLSQQALDIERNLGYH